MWIYVDNAFRVLSYNTNDMVGNTGWYETHDSLFAVQENVLENVGDRLEQSQEINVELYDHRGIPLYRYELDTDAVYERTQAEMDADYIPPAPVPNNDQRIADLEAAMAAIEEGIASV